ncbi:aldolase [bacterium]|nr:aldolase [bacterium]
MKITIPATVPIDQHKVYIDNYQTITKESDRLFVFAADQKMEHLNTDFFGPGLDPSINHLEHIFSIAAQSNIGVFATHLGLISRYGKLYPHVPYLAKLNGKTDLSDKEPYSQQLWSVQDAVDVARNGNLLLHAVGYTVYVGSYHESKMLQQAAQIVKDAHAQGLIAILWMYPRGKNIMNTKDAHLIAGAAGLGASLGADFVKINQPDAGPASLQEAVHAAGNTKVIVSGGPTIDQTVLLKTIQEQLQLGHVTGAAVGRNIFQHPLATAVKLANQIAQLMYT